MARARALTAVWVEQAAAGAGSARRTFLSFATESIHGESSTSDRDCVAMTERVLDGSTPATTDLQRGLRAIFASLFETTPTPSGA
jgi:hypothetical protein